MSYAQVSLGFSMSDTLVSLGFSMSDTFFLLHVFLFNYKYSYNITFQLLVFLRYHLSVISIPSILSFSSPILPFNYQDHFYLPLLPSILPQNCQGFSHISFHLPLLPSILSLNCQGFSHISFHLPLLPSILPLNCQVFSHISFHLLGFLISSQFNNWQISQRN